MKKAFLLLLSLLLIFFSFPLNAFAIDKIPELYSENIYLAELQSGKVMYEAGANVKVGTGYLSKIITGLIVLENTQDLEEKVTVSAKAIEGTQKDANAFLKAGEEMSVNDLLFCLLVRSGCDAANVLAEYVSGDISSFVDLMNKKAAAIGCKDTFFKNPSGIDAPGQFTTAYDMYLIGKEAAKNELFMKYADIGFKRIPATNKTQSDRYFTSNNYLLVTSTSVEKKFRDAYYESKAHGIMSSETDEAGNSAVTLLRSGGTEYICVVLNADRDIDTNLRGSYLDIKALCKWVYNSYKNSTILSAKTPIIEKKVKLSQDTEYITLIVPEDVTGLFPSDVDIKEYEVKYDVKDYYKAPIKKGEVLGTVTYYYNGIEYAKSDLVAQNSVESSYIDVMIDKVITFITSPWFLLIVTFIVAIVIIILIAKIRSKKRYNQYRNAKRYLYK